MIVIILITNTIIPYCYDMANILGLPNNFSHRFRYRNTWIEFPERISSMIGQNGLVVLRNFDTGDLIPVRFILIEEVITAGDINYIEFQLHDYFPIKKKAIISQKIIEILTNKGFENKGGQSLKYLVWEIDNKLLGEFDEPEEEQSLERWSSILQEVGHLSSFKDFGFLKIFRLRDSKGSQIFVKKDETGKYSFLLKPNQLLFLDVIQDIPWDIEKKESIDSPYDVELKAETDEVTILRKIQRVVGKYDLLRFIFKTPSGYSSKHTFLEVENKQSGEVVKYGLPSLFLPIRIQPSKWMQFIRYTKISIQGIAAIAVVFSECLSSMLDIKAGWITAFALLILISVSNIWDDVMKEVVKSKIV